MTGVKFKLAHKRADKEKWSLSDRARKKHLIKFLEDVIVGLYEDIKIEKIAPVERPKKKKKQELITAD